MTILDFTMRTDSTDTRSLIDMGLILQDQTAVLAGNVAQPNVADDQPGWSWRTRRTVHVSDINDSSQFTRVSEKVKSMRRFTGNEVSYLLVVNNPTLATINVEGIIRTLIKKP